MCAFFFLLLLFFSELELEYYISEMSVRPWWAKDLNHLETLNCNLGTSLVVQWLRLCAPYAGGPGSIPGQGTRSHVLQLKIPHSATKTWSSQINIFEKKKLQLSSWFSVGKEAQDSGLYWYKWKYWPQRSKKKKKKKSRRNLRNKTKGSKEGYWVWLDVKMWRIWGFTLLAD